MIDVPAQIDAVTRGLRTEQVDDGSPLTVQTLVQEYPVGIADLWDAVTSTDRIPRWFLPVSGDLRPGGRYQLQGNAGGEVLECDPPRDGAASYRVTWEMGEAVSWLRIRLAAVAGDRTSLELEHTARAADLPAGFWETYGPGATGVGWDGGLLGLALHLGTQDAALDPADALAWGMTDEGRSFYRGSADSWAQAHISAGADRAAATAAADRTYAFYTGEPPQPQAGDGAAKSD
ncbi:SRPBCC domain-containing protein [Cumulibacter manganitolerans]|uniref:SRPBCC domain-containing protein n=1 Tax=Cumulibacter manganitolerans TaxID=1884992 RepID=UPI0012973F9E|nr:SRPBCC domain-containing protein [Cumulibacter manganitolerans]